MSSRNNIFYSSGEEVGRPSQLENSYGREYETSPVFNFSNSATISAGAVTVLDFGSLKPACVKFLPFNILIVTNSSNVKIKVYPNQDRNRGFTVPAGTVRTFTQDQIRFIRTLAIENTSGSNSISANDLDIEVQKDIVTTDNMLKRLHKTFFSSERKDLA